MYTKIFTGAVFLALAAAGVAFSIPSVEGGCTLTNTRPCYDKIKNGSISILKKNAENAFGSCLSNSAPNEKGTTTMATAQCQEEQVSYAYCFEGKSHIYMRKFDGTCTPTPPPPPEPIPFRITSPNGGEMLNFGSLFPIRWEGGGPDWKINISVIQDNQVKRRLVFVPDSVANDGSEDWLIDLPAGTYTMYAEGCLNADCTEKAWDYGDGAFEVSGNVSKVNSSYITNNSIVVLSPSAGGETLRASSTQNIIWSGAASSSKIYISLIDYSAWTTHSTIVSETENDGSYSWNIPANIPPGQYLIHVKCSDCVQTYGWYGYSFKPFSIVAP